jgi:hypothetical protein
VAPKKYRRSHTFSGTGLLLAAAAVLSSGAAGCSNGEKTYGLQPLPSGTPSTPGRTRPVLTAEQQAVADAVTRYDAITKAMSDGAPLDMKKIRTVAVDPQATQVGRNLLILKAQKQRTTGRYETVIRRIKISGEKAEFSGCRDSAGTRVVSTGKNPTQVATGVGALVGNVSLVKIKDAWFVKSIAEGGKCEI